MHKIINTTLGKMIGTMAIVLLMGFYAQVSYAQIYDDSTDDQNQTTQQQTTDSTEDNSGDPTGAEDDTDTTSSDEASDANDASTLSEPGIPSTGMGGNAMTNLAAILASASLAGIGFMLMRRQEKAS